MSTIQIETYQLHKMVAAGLAIGTASALAAPAVLAAAGFGAAGVAAGSAAAAWQASIGNVIGGSIFAGLQSAGAAGMAATTTAATGAAAGGQDDEIVTAYQSVCIVSFAFAICMCIFLDWSFVPNHVFALIDDNFLIIDLVGATATGAAAGAGYMTSGAALGGG